MKFLFRAAKPLFQADFEVISVSIGIFCLEFDDSSLKYTQWSTICNKKFWKRMFLTMSNLMHKNEEIKVLNGLKNRNYLCFFLQSPHALTQCVPSDSPVLLT